MADQDFNINIRTLADTTGIKLTQQQLEALQDAAKRGNIAAIEALKKLSAAQKEAVESQKQLTASFGESAVGVGTIISLVTVAINKWIEFNAELDKQAEAMIKAQEKARALGEAILDMQDKARNAARVDNEPLEQSYARLRGEVIRLRTEMSLLNLPTQGEEWKKLNSELKDTEGLLNKVTSALEKQNTAKEKKRDKETSERRAFEVSAYEAEAKEAEAAGDPLRAQRARQTAEALGRGISREEITKQQEGIVGRRAGVGESQELVNQMERNRIGAEAMQKADPELLRRIDKLIEQWQ